jgi:hypothetical protein
MKIIQLGMIEHVLEYTEKEYSETFSDIKNILRKFDNISILKHTMSGPFRIVCINSDEDPEKYKNIKELKEAKDEVTINSILVIGKNETLTHYHDSDMRIFTGNHDIPMKLDRPNKQTQYFVLKDMPCMVKGPAGIREHINTILMTSYNTKLQNNDIIIKVM